MSAVTSIRIDAAKHMSRFLGRDFCYGVILLISFDFRRRCA
jgi:hypothetical protein